MPDLGMFGICDLRAFSREYPQIPKPAAPPPPIPPLHRTPVTRDLKIYSASYQCAPADPPPHRFPGRALLTAGRASAGQHLSPTRRRRKASSNSLPAFRAEQSVRPPGWDPAGSSIPPRAILLGATGVCRPRRSREQIRHSSTPQESGVRGGPPGHCELGPAVVQCGASGDQRKASRLRLCSALRFCSFTIPPKTPNHVRHNCARLRH